MKKPSNKSITPPDSPSHPQPSKKNQRQNHIQHPSHIVAIGASAGGLDALEKLFENISSESGAAFVVIQHLSPDYKSIMDSLLARHTPMPVRVVSNHMPIEANVIYLTPPGTLMQLEDGHFLLTSSIPRTFNLPIDIFFESLGKIYKNKSIGIILSGTGSDGTHGAHIIHQAGGLLVAQEPDDAKFTGMPHSIISTGLVDAILPASMIGKCIESHIASLSKINTLPQKKIKDTSKISTNEIHEEILQFLSDGCGINFSEYKPGTILRRIERRMTVRHTNTFEEYLNLLKSDNSELKTLRQELLISVTRFFRDPESYDALKNHIIDVLLAKKPLEQGIRVWCAGISTGEEAYSIGMLFLEAFDQCKHWPSLKIFATDIEQENIDFASAGKFQESDVNDLSPVQLERFFIKNGKTYEVKNELRQCIVFAQHNLLSHPPFTKIDVVVCRNVLIYFKGEAQLRALRRLQFALKPNALIFLGSSETLGPLQSDFQTISQRHKIWQVLKARTQLLDLDGHGIHNHTTPASSPKPSPRLPHWQQAIHSSDFVQRGYDTLLNAYAPPAAILVGSNQELLHSYGNIGKFLHLRPGHASLDINRLLPEPLIPVASALLFKSLRENTSTISDVLRLPSGHSSDGKAQMLLRLCAWPVPLAQPEGQEVRMTLLVFEEISETSPIQHTLPVDVQLETAERMEILQHELTATRESLQATIEELETSNEELQATNEEMMASNEELQSSNEELQSVNEELNTVNTEYQEKIEILHRVNADLENLSKVVASGTIFVDAHAHITRFSAGATDIFKLRDSDIGRPLSDISHNLEYPQFSEDIKNALHRQSMVEKEIHSAQGKFYLVKILPYKSSSSHHPGLVINFIDISNMRNSK